MPVHGGASAIIEAETATLVHDYNNLRAQYEDVLVELHGLQYHTKELKIELGGDT